MNTIPEDEQIHIRSWPPKVTALQFLISMKPTLPLSREKPLSQASNSELRRWCRDKSVIINGKQIGADDIVEFPVTQLVFFPKSEKNRCTVF